ncbi:YmfQ family protein [Chitiniphilus eburneus]|uniref:DUF2313 domain-containing protein n=1 Tax=Chitiniphilus eburneus TaxID=2571148 RepID=A0A4V5MS43_9NEIS|nr:putative phage tail protein [Chitiniphilus eburneus]TJZ78798.1 DUF2313 domain-containing protein [Chitiniphilus eburneus]
MAMTAEDYRQQLSALLPLGLAWPREPDSTLQRVLGAFGAGLAGVDSRSNELLRETYPPTSYELLADWERIAGLPDECSLLGSQTVQERRNAVAAKLAATGGQSRNYFINVAARYGHPNATITEYRARRYGHSRLGQRYGGWRWQFVWQLRLPVIPVVPRECGDPFGEPFQTWGDTQLECMINKLKPAHTWVLFSYGS